MFAPAGQGCDAGQAEGFEDRWDVLTDPRGQVSTGPRHIAIIDDAALIKRDCARSIVHGPEVPAALANGLGPMPCACETDGAEIEWTTHHRDIGA